MRKVVRLIVCRALELLIIEFGWVVGCEEGRFVGDGIL